MSGMLCEMRRRRQPDPIVVVDISARARRRDSSQAGQLPPWLSDLLPPPLTPGRLAESADGH